MDLVGIGAGIMIAMFVLNALVTVARTNTTRETTYTPALVIFILIANMLSIGVLLALLNRAAI